MKGKKLSLLLLSFFLFIILLLPTFAIADPGGPGDVGDPACDPECNCRPDMSICPIDSYVYVLLGIGVLYGIKKGKGCPKAASS